jgi:hypothetical protein
MKQSIMNIKEKTKEVDRRIDSLFLKRFQNKHNIDDLRDNMKAHICRYSILEDDCCSFQALSLLEDDSTLLDSSHLLSNFRKPLWNLLDKKWRQDKIIVNILPFLINHSSKGIGKGEALIPFIIRESRIPQKDVDAYIKGLGNIEVKSASSVCSLKATGLNLTRKGLVDDLNKKYWNGTVPGKTRKGLFLKHFNEAKKSPNKYEEYFRDLYVGCDENNLSRLLQNIIDERGYENPTAFNKALGYFALREYKRIDGWNSLVFVGEKEIVNICDVEDTNSIDSLNLSFAPILKRMSDGQNIPDGYVNIKI